MDDQRPERKPEEIVRVFDLAQKAAQIGIWWSDPQWQGRLIWTDETYRIFGLRKDQFDGRVETFFKLVHPDDFAYVAEASRAALAGEKPYDVVHRIVRPDGEVRWVRQTAEVVFGPDKKPVQMVGTVQDVTETRARELKLQVSEQSLRERNEELEKTIRIMVGRENRMIELKRKLEEAEKKEKGG